MANTLTTKIIENGPRNVILFIYLRSDGATGDFINQVVLDPQAELGMLRGQRLRFSNIQYNLAGFDAILEFDTGSVEKNPKWVLVEGANNPADFEKYGYLFDDSSALNGTGDVMITTSGFTSTADFGSILIRFVK